MHYRFSQDEKSLRDRLFALVNREQFEEARQLMGDVDASSPVLEELMEKAIRDNNVTLLEDVSRHVDNINKKRFFGGRTAAVMAAEMDRPHCLNKLVALNADIDVQDNDGETVILKICGLHGNIATLNEALAAGPTPGKQLPLFLGTFDFVNVGYNINHCNHDGQNSAALAVLNGNQHLLELLCQRGCDMSVRDKRGNAPIHHAIMKCNSGCLETLINLGVDLNFAQKYSGDTPAHLAVLNPGPDFEYKCLDVLVRYGADLTVMNTNSSSAILFQVTYPVNAYDLAEIQKLRGYPQSKNVIEEARKNPTFFSPMDPILGRLSAYSSASSDGVSASVSALATGVESAGSFLASPFISMASSAAFLMTSAEKNEVVGGEVAAETGNRTRNYGRNEEEDLA